MVPINLLQLFRSVVPHCSTGGIGAYSYVFDYGAIAKFVRILYAD